MGSGRSGTTWLGKMLTLGANVGFLNEAKLIWADRIAHEDLIGSYQLEMPHWHINPDDLPETSLRAVRRVYGAYAGLTRSRTVVEKYPELLYRFSLLQAVFPGVKCLFIVRDPIECVSSINAWNERHARADQDESWWGKQDRKWQMVVEGYAQTFRLSDSEREVIHNIGDDQLRGLVEWVLAAALASDVRQRIGERMLFVRYEDLLASPVESLRAIMCWLDVPVHPRQEQYLELATRPPRSYAGRSDLLTRLAGYPALLAGVRRYATQYGYDMEDAK